MTQFFQLSPHCEVIVNLSVEHNPAVAVFRQDGLIAVIEIDDFQACRAQREEV